jgi:hypothetical protein
MHRRTIAGSLLLATTAAVVGCARQFVPAPFGTPLDEVCNPANGQLAADVDTFRLGSADITTGRGWTTRQASAQELELRRIDAELTVWRGSRFVFPALQPRNAVRCELTRGDTTIKIQAARLDGFTYRVDVAWDPLIDGQYFYMQLETRYVEHLRQMRGIVEGVRFRTDTLALRR